MKQTQTTLITFAEFKKLFFMYDGYAIEAFEDIPSFAKKGHGLYGNCDSLTVRDFAPLKNGAMKVWLSN